MGVAVAVIVAMSMSVIVAVIVSVIVSVIVAVIVAVTVTVTVPVLVSVIMVVPAAGAMHVTVLEGVQLVVQRVVDDLERHLVEDAERSARHAGTAKTTQEASKETH